MSTIDKYIALVLSLNRKTQEGSLKWQRRVPPDSITQGTNSIINDFFFTKHKNKIIGIYEETFEDRSYGSTWEKIVKLGLFNENFEVDFDFPSIVGLNELMDSVRHQVSGVQELFEEFLDEEDLKRIENERTKKEQKFQDDLPF